MALEKWEAFVKAALRQDDTVYILDSSIFQYQIFTYLLAGAEYSRLAVLVRRIMEMLKPLDPLLIYLYRENTEGANMRPGCSGSSAWNAGMRLSAGQRTGNISAPRTASPFQLKTV